MSKFSIFEIIFHPLFAAKIPQNLVGVLRLYVELEERTNERTVPYRVPLIRITRGFRILSESFTSRRITESGSQTDPEILEQKELQLLRSNSLKSSAVAASR